MNDISNEHLIPGTNNVDKRNPIKSSRLPIISLVIAVVILMSFTIYINLVGTENVSQKITTLEKKETADVVAKIWCDDSLIMSVSMQERNDNGDITAWRYTYYSPSTETFVDNHSIYMCMKVYIYFNGTYKTNIFNSSFVNPIEDWTIDSDDAYEIALDNSEITTFLRHDPGLFLFQLSNDSTRSIWQIEWAYDAGFDDPKWAEIQIDANTGEILYVEVDN